MCTFATRLVSLLLLLTVSAPNAVAQEADEETVVRRASESWDVIRTYFDPPASFANEFSAHRSPLLFDNGSDVHTAADWKRRRTELLDRWTKLLGQWPPLITQPQVETLDTKQREDFVQHTIRFRWTPGESTTAYLLIPEGTEKRPAVLSVFYEPETAIGFNNPHRDFALQLAKRGFVTLSIGTTHASKANTYALYYPDIDNATVQPLSMLGYAAVNAWHVLASRAEVDEKRIGIVGHSFGGKWAMFAGCPVRPVCGGGRVGPGNHVRCTSQRKLLGAMVSRLAPAPRGVSEVSSRPRIRAAVCIHGLLEDHLDLHELHALMAPRPFLVSGGAVDPPSRWRALNHLVKINETLGYRQRVGMTNRPDHSPNEQSNAVIYGFFDHFLRAKAKEGTNK